MYGRLYHVIDNFWRFRAALLWDAFPKKRLVALQYCREKYVTVSQKLTEGLTAKPNDYAFSSGFGQLGKACDLLQGNLTTEAFAESVYALADIYSVVFFVSVEQDSWYLLKKFYQDLYDVFLA
jgi:hypothetical protein